MHNFCEMLVTIKSYKHKYRRRGSTSIAMEANQRVESVPKYRWLFGCGSHEQFMACIYTNLQKYMYMRIYLCLCMYVCMWSILVGDFNSFAAAIALTTVCPFLLLVFQRVAVIFVVICHCIYLQMPRFGVVNCGFRITNVLVLYLCACVCVYAVVCMRTFILAPAVDNESDRQINFLKFIS